MRTLSGIIDAVKDGKDVPYDELYYALVVVENLRIMNATALLDCTIGKYAESLTAKNLIGRLSFDRDKRAMKSNPKTWLGKHNDPRNPSCQAIRKFSKKLVEKIHAETKED